MTSTNWATKEFSTGHVALFTGVLVVSALSGRQLFMDGANFVVQLALDPFWYPADQETPRRIFAVMWTTAPVRLLCSLRYCRFELLALLFGAAAYLQLVLPLIVIVHSKLTEIIKSIILILFLSATCFLANIPATELLFALGLTTIFVTYALDPAQDPKLNYRLVIGLLLMASYEVVALSNVVLAIGTCISSHPQQASKKKYALAGVLSLALPFQMICRFLEPTTPGEGVLHWFTLAISGIFVLVLFIGAAFFKLIGTSNVVRAGAIFVLFAIPLTLLLTPDLIGVRTRAFQYAYASRVYSAGITLVMATLPIILNRDLVSSPRQILEDWLGEPPLRGLGLAMLAGFFGVSLVASSDAYFYRVRLDEELAQLFGFVAVEDCSFCLEPTKFGLPNLSYPGVMPVYSMAHTLKHPELPPVIVLRQEDIGRYVSREQLDAFMSHQLAARQKKDDG
jgi:hypothetical protein